MKKVIFIIVVLGLSFSTFGQSDSLKFRNIDMKVYVIDSIFNKIKSTSFTKIDSINVNITDYGNKIETSNRFSSGELLINFYLEGGKVILIKVIEQSPVYKDMSSIKELYFEKDKLINESFFYTVQVCVPFHWKDDFNEIYGYNLMFTSEYLKEYSNKLIKDILE